MHEDETGEISEEEWEHPENAENGIIASGWDMDIFKMYGVLLFTGVSSHII